VSSRVGHSDGLVFTSGQVFGQLVFCAIFVFFVKTMCMVYVQYINKIFLIKLMRYDIQLNALKLKACPVAILPYISVYVQLISGHHA